MDNPKISWQVLEYVDSNNEETEYVQYKSYTEEGSFIPGDYIRKVFRVWNNHNGKTDVKDAKGLFL